MSTQHLHPRRRRTATRLATTAALAVVLSGCAANDPGPYRLGATIEVGAAPHGIRFSADGDTAYVALTGDGQGRGRRPHGPGGSRAVGRRHDAPRPHPRRGRLARHPVHGLHPDRTRRGRPDHPRRGLERRRGAVAVHARDRARPGLGHERVCRSPVGRGHGHRSPGRLPRDRRPTLSRRRDVGRLARVRAQHGRGHRLRDRPPQRGDRCHGRGLSRARPARRADPRSRHLRRGLRRLRRIGLRQHGIVRGHGAGPGPGSPPLLGGRPRRRTLRSRQQRGRKHRVGRGPGDAYGGADHRSRRAAHRRPRPPRRRARVRGQRGRRHAGRTGSGRVTRDLGSGWGVAHHCRRARAQ